jgi:hypothetical protein
MTTALYLVASEAMPSLGEGTAMLMVQGEGEPEPPGDLDVMSGEYGCVTTLVAQYSDLGALCVAVSEWWQDMAGVAPRLDLLATDLSAMASDQRDSIAELDRESWSIRTPLFVFRNGSPDAEAEARAVVTKAALSAD